jgi:hypothetical protein
VIDFGDGEGGLFVRFVSDHGVSRWVSLFACGLDVRSLGWET